MFLQRTPLDDYADWMNPKHPAFKWPSPGPAGYDAYKAKQLNPNKPNCVGSPDDSPDGNDGDRVNQLNPNTSKDAEELV